ncbi:YcfL family protein [Spirabiliibacterium falconis]|uniref:YcfL family protein n=1 Tax=Spirabiliibacterium falconis TaxID=572023 RepID=UPI001AADE0EF|nr:YcfL family protein [Spirabiliibacterium falconis]MBE2893787.1 YcfL family protein [Spirabiliibacterium falconis]
MKKTIFLTALCLFLSACTSSPQRYLVSDEPIVNIDSHIAAQAQVEANLSQVVLKNLTAQILALHYQITWYDANGVTQLANWEQAPQWSCLTLQPQSAVRIGLHKPTEASKNYRLYIMGKGSE